MERTLIATASVLHVFLYTNRGMNAWCEFTNQDSSYNFSYIYMYVRAFSGVN